MIDYWFVNCPSKEITSFGRKFPKLNRNCPFEDSWIYSSWTSIGEDIIIQQLQYKESKDSSKDTRNFRTKNTSSCFKDFQLSKKLVSETKERHAVHFKTLLWPGRISIIFCSCTTGTFFQIKATRQVQKMEKKLHNRISRSKQRLLYVLINKYTYASLFKKIFASYFLLI